MTTLDESKTAVLREKFIDAAVPGFAPEFDAQEADQAGAFAEDALTEADAADSVHDEDGGA